MTELYRTGDKSLVVSMDLRIIFDRFLGGKLSSGSGEEGAGDTGFELGGVRMCCSGISSTANAASTRRLMSSPAVNGVSCVVWEKYAGRLRAATTSELRDIKLRTVSVHGLKSSYARSDTDAAAARSSTPEVGFAAW